MTLTEVDVFGVFISPYAAILLAVWASVFALRLVLTRTGVLVHAWHPALLMFSIFVMTLSAAVLLAISP